MVDCGLPDIQINLLKTCYQSQLKESPFADSIRQRFISGEIRANSTQFLHSAALSISRFVLWFSVFG